MTVGLASAAADGLLDDLITSGSGVWVKLHTGDPGAAGTANAATETTRQEASFAAASGGQADTDTDLVWTNVAGTETIAYLSFWDDETAGAFLASDILNSSRPLTAGDNLTIEAGDGTLTLGPVAA